MKKTTNRYDGMTLLELYNIQDQVTRGYDAREFHKALRKHGDGLPLCYRYPVMYPIIANVVVVAVVLLLIVLCFA